MWGKGVEFRGRRDQDERSLFALCLALTLGREKTAILLTPLPLKSSATVANRAASGNPQATEEFPNLPTVPQPPEVQPLTGRIPADARGDRWAIAGTHWHCNRDVVVGIGLPRSYALRFVLQKLVQLKLLVLDVAPVFPLQHPVTE